MIQNFIAPTIKEPTQQNPVAPSTQKFNLELEKILSSLPSILDTSVTELRAVRESGQGKMGLLIKLDDIARTREIQGPRGGIKLRIFTPPEVNGIYLHFHEGGWVLGGAHHQDVLLWKLANECNVTVVSVDYRLAPEHPYPAGPDDCEYATLWLIDNALGEFGTEKILIGGESTGAHLAVSTLLTLRDHYGYTGFCGANLCYGLYDLTFSPSLRNCIKSNLTLDLQKTQLFCDYFLFDSETDFDARTGPDLSPLFADLSTMPPALFTVGTYDALLDDSLFMHSRWAAAGNQSILAKYNGAPHRFTLMSHPLSQPAKQKIHQFLTAQIA